MVDIKTIYKKRHVSTVDHTPSFIFMVFFPQKLTNKIKDNMCDYKGNSLSDKYHCFCKFNGIKIQFLKKTKS